MQLHTGNGNIRRISGIRTGFVGYRNFYRIAHIVTDVGIFPVKEFQVGILLNLFIADGTAAFTAPVLAGHVRQQAPVRRLVHQDIMYRFFFFIFIFCFLARQEIKHQFTTT